MVGAGVWWCKQVGTIWVGGRGWVVKCARGVFPWITILNFFYYIILVCNIAWGGHFMSEWVATWVRRWASGWGGHHSVMSHVTQCERRCWQYSLALVYPKSWSWKEVLPLFNFVRSIWGIYNNKIIEQLCNQTASLEHITQYAHYIGLIRMLYNNTVAKCALNHLPLNHVTWQSCDQ